MNVPDQDYTHGESAESNSHQPIESTPTLPPRGESLMASIGPGLSGTVTLPPTQSAGATVNGRGLMPDVLGYEINAELGRGGMGVVYKARHVKLNRIVALKMILAGNYASQADLVRFLAEAEAVAALQHPNIVQLFEAGQHNGLPFFTLEYLEGGTLSDKVRDQPLPPREAATLIEQVAHGVQFAHDKGVVHRDLKPDNVLLTGNGTPKVADFGLAKRVQAPSGLTQTGAVLGTPSYMAPEQADGKGKPVGPPADVYALGAILYRLIAGRPPFQAATPLDTMLQVVSDEAVPPSQMQSKTPKDLETICLKCLQKEPAKRYDSAQALADDLGRFLRGESIVARPVGAFERASKWVKRNPVVAALLTTVIVLLLLGTVIGTYMALRFRSMKVAAEGQAQNLEAAVKGNLVLIRAKQEQQEATEKARNDEAVQRKIAEKARDRTRQALDDMTSSIIGNSLIAQKEISPEQRKFLSEVLTYYTEFAGEKAEDEQSKSRTAEAASRVGDIEGILGHKKEAMAAFQMAADKYQELADEFPAVPKYLIQQAWSHQNLGNLLFSLEKLAEAEGQHQKAIALFEKLAARFPAVPQRLDLACIHTSFGNMKVSQGKYAEAEKHLVQALSIFEKLAAEFPTDPTHGWRLAMGHNNLGLVFAGRGHDSEAADQYRQAIEIQQKLVANFPTEPLDRSGVALAHYNLGTVLKRARKFGEAKEHYEQATAIWERLAADYPAMVEYRRRLAPTYADLAALSKDLGNPIEAEKIFQKAIGMWEKLAGGSSAVPEFQLYLGGTCCDFGSFVRDSGRSNESLIWYEKAIRSLTTLLRQDRGHVTAKRFLRNCYLSRATAHDNLQKYAEAAKDWGQAIELSPIAEQSILRVARAISRVHAGQVVEAIAEVAELTRAGSWNANQWYNFGCVYATASAKVASKRQEYADRAMELLTKAVKSGFQDAAQMTKDTDLEPLHDRADFKKLLADMETKSPPKGDK